MIFSGIIVFVLALILIYKIGPSVDEKDDFIKNILLGPGHIFKLDKYYNKYRNDKEKLIWYYMSIILLILFFISIFFI